MAGGPDDFFGGLFNLDVDGATSFDEEFLGFMVLDDIDRENRLTFGDAPSFLGLDDADDAGDI